MAKYNSGNLEKQIARAMIEAKKILAGEIEAQLASSLLKELKNRDRLKHMIKKGAKKKYNKSQ